MRVLLFFICFLFSSFLCAQDVFPTLRVKELVSVYDGDTFKVNLFRNQVNHPLFRENISIRVFGIDTPEIRGNCPQEKELAYKARDLADSVLRAGESIRLRNPEKDKYFRILADVYVDDIRLIDILISRGLGVEYYGKGIKKDWCE